MENLAYACTFCNRRKGSDVASLTSGSAVLTRLFNPRTDRWSEHFKFGSDGLTIEANTDIGAVTIKLLDLNHADRLLEREALRAVKRYPSAAALSRINQ
jgi:hypothetical protein